MQHTEYQSCRREGTWGVKQANIDCDNHPLTTFLPLMQLRYGDMIDFRSFLFPVLIFVLFCALHCCAIDIACLLARIDKP